MFGTSTNPAGRVFSSPVLPRLSYCLLLLAVLSRLAYTAATGHQQQRPILNEQGPATSNENHETSNNDRNRNASDGRGISFELFRDLEELSRIVDVSYCVGVTGIQKPFLCAGRCQDFEGFELVTVRSMNP